MAVRKSGVLHGVTVRGEDEAVCSARLVLILQPQARGREYRKVCTNVTRIYYLVT